MLTGIIVAAMLYVLLFTVLWSRTRFAKRRVAPQPLTRVVPWNGHLYTEAPTEAEVAELFLRKDLELAGRGQ